MKFRIVFLALVLTTLWISTAIAQTYSFDIRAPESITGTVGKPINFKVDIANTGTAKDSYTVTVEASSPNLVDISEATQTTQEISPNSATGAFITITPLVESANEIKVTVTSINCTTCQSKTLEITMISSLRSLPEFGPMGLLQIIVLSAVLYFLFVNKLRPSN